MNYNTNFSLTLTSKNYSAVELASQISNIANATYASISCAFDNQTGKITITLGGLGGADQVTSASFNASNTCDILIGFVSTTTKTGNQSTLLFEVY